MILHHLILQKIEEIKKTGFYREIPDFEQTCRNNPPGNKKKIINLAANDYLNLSSNKDVIKAAQDALEDCGASSSSSFLIYGHSRLHRKLEELLCRFKGGYEKCILYPSGYQANGGVIRALTGLSPLNTFIIFDELSHASIIDGVLSSGTRFKSFRHNDLNHLEQILKKNKGAENSKAVKIIITEGVFSMEGDIPDLPGILYLCEKFDALCVVDDAHATGTIGKSGGGSLDHHGLGNAQGRRPDIIIGTLGKALASHGAFVLSRKSIIDYLINFSRAFIFSTGLPSSAAAASIQAIRIIGKNPSLVGKLQKNSARARELIKNAGFDTLKSSTQIIPILIGDEKKALAAEKMLLNEGIYLKAIRYPSVAKGKARLRLAVNNAVNQKNMEEAINRIATVIKGI